MMRGPEKQAFEDRVLSYLDGALDDASSERLLGEIAQDTEKQEIFAAHQELDKLIMTARVPLETPEETRRSIAAVIPGLTMYLPEFITTGTGVGLLASRWRAVLDFFTQTPLRTALTIGGAAAVITTGVVVTNNLSEKAPAPQHGVVAVSQSPGAVNPEQALQASQQSDLSSTTNQSSGANASSAAASTYPSYSTKAATSKTSTRDIRASLPGRMLNVEQENPELNARHASSNAASITAPDLAAIASVHGQISNDPAPALAAQRNILRPIPVQSTSYYSPLGFSLSATSGVRLLQRPSVDGQSQPVDVSIPSTLSLRYSLNDNISLLAEGGDEHFVRIRETGSLQKSFGALEHFRVMTTVISDNSYWTRAGAEYQWINEGWSWTPFVAATAGVAFADKLAPMVGATAGAKYYLSDYVKLIGSVTYDQTWMARERENFTIPESAVVDQYDLVGSTVTNSAFNISFGVSTSF